VAVFSLLTNDPLKQVKRMTVEISEFTNEQTTRLASFCSQMQPMWPSKLSRMSSGLGIYIGLL